MISKEYTAFAVMILGFLLPKIGVEVDANALATTIHTIVMVGAGIVGLVARYSKGDIDLLGRKAY